MMKWSPDTPESYERLHKSLWKAASSEETEIKVKEKEERENNKEEINRELGAQLKKLSVKEGDIIIVHLACKPKPGLQELVRQLMGMKPVKNLRIPVLIIPAELELSVMSEKEMNAVGWYKRGHRLVRPVT